MRVDIETFNKCDFFFKAVKLVKLVDENVF